MSDGIVRICNAHQMELRQIGATFACPHGHDCPTDWSVKEARPYVDARDPRPTCPIHGCRLTGAGSVLECQYGHQCTTRKPEQPKQEPAAMPKTKIEHPHGTALRYWAGCKGPDGCRPCKDAVNAHVKALKARKLVAKRATEAPNPAKPRRVSIRSQRSKPTPPTLGADLERRILTLRSELAEAEEAYLAHVATIVPRG